MNELYKSMPLVSVPENLSAPMPELTVSGNGVKIYSLNSTERDVLRVSFVFRAGSSVQDLPFSASATANLLSEGTGSYTAQEIAEILDYHGSYFDVSLDRDYAVITFVMLSKFVEQTLQMAHEILIDPVFPEHEVAIYCDKRKQRLAIERSKVAFRAREYFAHALFGDEHPYGVSYEETEYDKLNRDILKDFYRKFYISGNCFIVCSGRIGDDEIKQVADLASKLPANEVGAPGLFIDPVPTRLMLKPHPDAVQSAIRIGTRLFTRTHTDFIPMQVVSTILGGYFGSRLVRNLREERGYTYGVFSSMVNLEQSGYLAIATEVAGEASEDAVKQIFLEMKRLRTEPVPAEELDMVRNIMTGEIMRILDGPFGIADVTIENIQNHTDNGYIERLFNEIRTITPEKVLETAANYLVPDNFSTVVVGDESILKSLGGGPWS